MDVRNYKVSQTITRILNSVKNFEAANSDNPRKGNIVLKYEGDYFLVKISPIYTNTIDNPATIDEVINANRHLLS